MMTYFLDSPFDSGDFYSPLGPSTSRRPRPARREGVHVLAEKLRIPKYHRLIERPRLDDLLSKSTDQFPATLISGRTGTGKTALASAFARGHQHAAWYSVESSDVEWNVFAHYFAACVLRAVDSNLKPSEVLPTLGDQSQASIASSLISIFAEAETQLIHQPLLIVLDGIHCIFDAPWFGEFFSLLLSSLPEHTSLLLLCRSKPPNPLWRLRSKQQLNVIDEKLLAFTLPETVELMTKAGLKRTLAEQAHAATFGRVSKLVEFVDEERRRRA